MAAPSSIQTGGAKTGDTPFEGRLLENNSIQGHLFANSRQPERATRQTMIVRTVVHTVFLPVSFILS